MTTLGELVTEIETQFARADAFQNAAKKEVARVVRSLERRYDFLYMHDRSKTESITEGTAAYTWSFSEVFKEINFAWREDTDGFIHPLKIVMPSQQYQQESALPEGMILNGRTGFQFTETPSEDFTLKLDLLLYTTWSTLDSATHWLFDNAEDVLIHMTVAGLALQDEDSELYQLHSQAGKERLEELLNAEVLTEYGGARHMEMGYAGFSDT